MTQSQTHSDAPDMKLFWCCFAALITVSHNEADVIWFPVIIIGFSNLFGLVHVCV
jgi:hypothetical protein